MVEIKYKREAKKKKIKGMKDPITVYKKTGSSKLYVKCKGKMRSYVSYKKSCLKKLSAKKAKPVKRKTRVRGGNSCNMNKDAQQGGQNEYLNLINSQNRQQGGQEDLSTYTENLLQSGGIFNLLDNMKMSQGGKRVSKKKLPKPKGEKGKKIIRGGSEDDALQMEDMNMEDMNMEDITERNEGYENNIDDKGSGVLGGGRRRSRRAASPKRRRAASPKRKRAASPKRKRSTRR